MFPPQCDLKRADQVGADEGDAGRPRKEAPEREATEVIAVVPSKTAVIAAIVLGVRWSRRS
jgi:hypothetical protein